MDGLLLPERDGWSIGRDIGANSIYEILWRCERAGRTLLWGRSAGCWGEGVGGLGVKDEAPEETDVWKLCEGVAVEGWL